MKFLILLALVAAASAASLNADVNSRFNLEFRQRLYSYLGVEPQADLIPPLNETIKINDTKIDFNNEEQQLIIGHVELIGSTVTGLNTLEDDIDFNLLTLKASGTVTVDIARIFGLYGADLIIHLPFTQPPFKNETIAVGVGAGDLGVEGAKITFSATIIPNFITNRVHINKLDADVLLTALHLYLENLVVDEELVNWDEVNQDALAWFEELIHGPQRPTILTAVQEIINFILKDIPLSDIIGG